MFAEDILFSRTCKDFLLRSSPLHRTSRYRICSVDNDELNSTEPFLESCLHDGYGARRNCAEDQIYGYGESPSSEQASSCATPCWVGPLLGLAIYTCFTVFAIVMVLPVRQEATQDPRTLECKSPLH